MDKKLFNLITSSNRILITSHISPDTDAISSVLLMGMTLKANFTNIEIVMTMEELFDEVNFLNGYNDIICQELSDALDNYNPDLLIMLDGNNYDRFSRKDALKVRQVVKDKGIKTAIIDHHEPDETDSADVYINNQSPATAMDVYEVCFEQLKLSPPADYATTAMTGLYADSGGFKFCRPHLRGKMFSVAKDLAEEGADLEQIYFQLNKYTKDDFLVLAELIKNLSAEDNYTYSWLSDKFVNTWLEHKSQTELEPGTDIFINEYLRTIDGRQWGFVVNKNSLQGDDYYSVSFRAIDGIKDVSRIAIKLGGGGHKGAAGARFVAPNVDVAIKKVKDVIDNSSD